MLVEWDPTHRKTPPVDFLFLTSARKKAAGLNSAMGNSDVRFGYWSPSNPPLEPNHLNLRGLIRTKARDLTSAAVRQLDEELFLANNDIPTKFLTCDVHPSLSNPGETGQIHLVKPPSNLSYEGLMNFVRAPWIRFEDRPVTVQLASAYAMTDRASRLITNEPMQDSVFITYQHNPLPTEEDVDEYLRAVRRERFDGLREDEFIAGISNIAGGIMQEILYVEAAKKGNVGEISRALRCSGEIIGVSDIDAIGAGGLTSALVGWIAVQAKRSVRG